MTDEFFTQFAKQALAQEAFSDAARETFAKLGAVERRIVENLMVKIAMLAQQQDELVDDATYGLVSALAANMDSSEYGPVATVEAIIERIYDGQDKYGLFNPETEKRDFRRELFEEIVDGLVYNEAGVVMSDGGRP